MSREVVELVSEAQLRGAWPVLQQLRPHLDEAAFLAAVATQRAEGFRLAALLEDGAVRAVAGFRLCHMLARGRHIYVDDLVTDETRRDGGYGKQLIEWLIAEARRLGCARFHLDSGVQRFAAHAFYFGRRMHIQAYHFGLDLHAG